MEFGIFSNGFRALTSAARTYDEDIHEIALADRLGFTQAYISEHHGEPPYIGKVDTIPIPEMMMCKAAALTKQIRMGSAVKLIHIHHPLDVAIEAAVADHLTAGRYIFGFGSGFPSPLFSEERGLTYEDRHARLAESLDFILKCCGSSEPFDWDGKYWRGKGVVSLPKPFTFPHMPMATATDSEPMLQLAGERGYICLSAFLETPGFIRKKLEIYGRAARKVGRQNPLKNMTVARIIYIAGSRQEAIEDMREAVTYEVSVQAQRGFLKMLKAVYNLEVPNNEHAIEHMAEAGIYILGDADHVAAQLREFYAASGGFGTLLMVTGKNWATRERRARSMRSFIEHVAPKLRDLTPNDPPAVYRK